MKLFKLSVGFFVITLGACVASKAINERPMYGSVEKSAELKQADQKFIETVTQNVTRDSASRHFSGRGFQLLQNGDYRTAIKRFNQAWLLDSTNYEAYWGFAAYSRSTNQPEYIVSRYLSKAYDYNSENCTLTIQYLTSLYFLKEKGVEPNLQLVRTVFSNYEV